MATYILLKSRNLKILTQLPNLGQNFRSFFLGKHIKANISGDADNDEGDDDDGVGDDDDDDDDDDNADSHVTLSLKVGLASI